MGKLDRKTVDSLNWNWKKTYHRKDDKGWGGAFGAVIDMWCKPLILVVNEKGNLLSLDLLKQCYGALKVTIRI